MSPVIARSIVEKIEDLVLLEEVFTRPGPNYKRDDSAMKTIYCQL